MCETISSLITELKAIEVKAKLINDSRKTAINKLKCLDEQLDQLSDKRSQILAELELAYSSEQSDNEFHSLTSDGEITGFYSDGESIPQKRKTRSNGSNNSDLDSKKIKSDDIEELECPKTIDEVNNFDQQMIDKYIDDMADQLAKEYRNPDDHLKEALVVLASEPDFESLVNDVEHDSLSNSSKTLTFDSIEFSPISFTNVTVRKQCRNRNSKENITPPADYGFDQTFPFSSNGKQYYKTDKNDNQNKCNYFAADSSSPPFSASKVLKGKKLLTDLLSNNNSLVEKNKSRNSFSPSIDTKTKSFRDQMKIWQERENCGIIEFKPNRTKTNTKMCDAIESI